MKGINHWNFSPYMPIDQLGRLAHPYICRLAPSETGIEFEWFDKTCSEINHTVICCEYIKEGVLPIAVSKPLDSYTCKLTNLDADSEYMLYVVRNNDQAKSLERRFRTGYVPGTVVNYLHPSDPAYEFSGKYLCSPSIVKLESGALLASMDVFAGGAPQNLSLLFRSDNRGETWSYVTDLFPCFWGKLFCHKGILYMFANSTEYGDLMIGSSKDEGRTWSAPVRIFVGSSSNLAKGFHKGPMPVISHSGRLWTGVDYGAWSCGGHNNALLSIDENADLLVPENWNCSGFTTYDSSWAGTAKGNCYGCLEGNAVAAPNGDIYNFLRYQINDCIPNHGKALILKGDINNPEKQLVFERIVDFNSALSKFDVLRDDKTGYYITLVSKVVNSDTPGQRNIVAALVSNDLIDWKEAEILIDYSNMPPEKVGFQYIDFIINDEDIFYLSRTAFNHAANYHDSNYITFHKIGNFRRYFDTI